MKHSSITITEDNTLQFEDTQYIIMTEDKKCIVRGRKNTAFILSTIGEECSKKVFMCTQYQVILRHMIRGCNNSRLNLTDNVKKLYDIDEKYYHNSNIPKLIAIKVKSSIQAKLN